MRFPGAAASVAMVLVRERKKPRAKARDSLVHVLVVVYLISKLMSSTGTTPVMVPETECGAAPQTSP